MIKNIKRILVTKPHSNQNAVDIFHELLYLWRKRFSSIFAEIAEKSTGCQCSDSYLWNFNAAFILLYVCE